MEIITRKAENSPLATMLKMGVCAALLVSSAMVMNIVDVRQATAQTTTAAPANIAGQWRTDDNKAIITVAPCTTGSAAHCGRITRMLGPQPAGGVHDENNPNAALRSRPVLGITILNTLTRRGNRWTGAGYSPEEGRNFNATLSTEGNRLNVRGCVAIFCRNLQWTRVS